MVREELFQQKGRLGSRVRFICVNPVSTSEEKAELE
jgi:hypothetical protein